jgi:hypothetical protein
VRADSITSARIMSMPAAKLLGWLRCNCSPKAATRGLRIGSASRAASGSAQAATPVASK